MAANSDSFFNHSRNIYLTAWRKGAHVVAYEGRHATLPPVELLRSAMALGMHARLKSKEEREDADSVATAAGGRSRSRRSRRRRGRSPAPALHH